MSKVIIGIHGLSNKPPEDTLAGWWKDGILFINRGAANDRWQKIAIYSG